MLDNSKYDKGILYWITGLSGAGKTTIGNRLYYELKKERDDVILLDGDILKKVFEDDGKDLYSDEARRSRALKYSRICKMLSDQGLAVICCTIAMYDNVREWNRRNNRKYVEVFLDVPLDVLAERDQKGLYSKKKKGLYNENLAGVDLQVELPRNPDVIIRNDGRFSVKECVDQILQFKPVFANDFDRDTNYWNNFYNKTTNLNEPSLFAKECIKHLKKGGSLLELGCGNGRDSSFFARNDMNVTAIDASPDAIDALEKANLEGNIYFICDDFVTASALFTGQYDYCYSRFSLHAVNEEQEELVIKNVFNVIKNGGKFFIECRSVNDEIYGKGKQVGRDAFYYDGHYRRFIRKEELENKLKQVGFEIEYSEESRGFAPFQNSDPKVIRVIALKK